MVALEGSSVINPREISPPKLGGRPVVHKILSLDPNKFAEKKQHRLHIGGIASFVPHVSLQKQSSSLVKRMRMVYDPTNRKRPPYPPDTKAFLYYFTSPEKPRIAGEVRLRVASSDDPASFESGSDLVRTDGRPWSRPLYVISKLYHPLYEKLREEGLVPDDLDKVLSTLSLKNLNPSYGRSQILYTLTDTFIVDFSSELRFLVITEQGGMQQLLIGLTFYDTRRTCKGTPYTGRALARLERSTLLNRKGTTRTVVLRFLKIITPVKCVKPLYDGYICCPREGELYQRYRRTVKTVWRFNIDKSNGRGLQSLWDAQFNPSI